MLFVYKVGEIVCKSCLIIKVSKEMGEKGVDTNQSKSVLIDVPNTETDGIDLDCLIDRLKEAKFSRHVDLKEAEVNALCHKCKVVIEAEPMLLELHAPIVVVGDIHGHFPELMKWFSLVGYPGETNFLFLGNYINRGEFSLETISLLMCYKVKYPRFIHLLRGNHESYNMIRCYGFQEECRKRYKTKIDRAFVEVFNNLPLAALVDNRIFCCHGGLSPELHNFDQIRKIPRPIEKIDHGLACDLLWADPDKSEAWWGVNARGISVTFGADIVSKFIAKHDLELICRSSEVVEEGYEFFAKRQLLTLFSALHYCGEYDNGAAILSIQNGLGCTLKVLKQCSVSATKSASKPAF